MVEHARDDDGLDQGAPAEGVHYATMSLPCAVLAVDWARIDPDGQPRGYQRPTSEAHLKALGTFNPDICGQIKVNRREDGSLWIMDGAHRWLLAKRDGYLRINADVFQVRPEQEADFFRWWNRRPRRISRGQDFFAALRAGDVPAHDILRIVRANGFELSEDPGSKRSYHITAIGALEALYCGARPAMNPDPDKLSAVLGVIRGAWPDTPHARDELILRGLDRLFLRYGERIRRERLTKVLSVEDPKDLMARGRDLRHRARKSTDRCLADIFEALYNQNQRGANRLSQDEE